MKNPESVRAVGVNRVSNSVEFEYSNLPQSPSNSKSKIRRDARVLQYLKKECQHTGTGAVTLQAVFAGLLSVHNRNLNSFTEALKIEREINNE